MRCRPGGKKIITGPRALLCSTRGRDQSSPQHARSSLVVVFWRPFAAMVLRGIGVCIPVLLLSAAASEVRARSPSLTSSGITSDHRSQVPLAGSTELVESGRLSGAVARMSAADARLAYSPDAAASVSANGDYVYSKNILPACKVPKNYAGNTGPCGASALCPLASCAALVV